MKNKLQLIPACIAALALCAPVAASAATKTSPSPTPAANASPAAKAAASPAAKTAMSPAAKSTKAPGATMERAFPFHGVISTVDQTAKTFTIAGKEKARVFKVTDKTVLTKAGVPATMTEVMANEEVRGSYSKAADGSLEAKTVKLGPMTDAEKAAGSKRSKKKAKAEASTDASPAASPAASPSASAKP